MNINNRNELIYKVYYKPGKKRTVTLLVIYGSCVPGLAIGLLGSSVLRPGLRCRLRSILGLRAVRLLGCCILGPGLRSRLSILRLRGVRLLRSCILRTRLRCRLCVLPSGILGLRSGRNRLSGLGLLYGLSGLCLLYRLCRLCFLLRLIHRIRKSC